MALLKKIFTIPSIRLKLSALPVVGILGMLIIAGASHYLDNRKSVFFTLIEQFQRVSTMVHKMHKDEERFLGSTDEDVLALVSQHQIALNGMLAEIANTASAHGMGSASQGIKESVLNHTATFESLIDNVRKMDDITRKLFAAIDQIHEALNNLVEEIDTEEATLFYEGEYLTHDKKGLREEIKDIFALNSQRMLNIQNLFMNRNPQAFENRRLELNALSDQKMVSINVMVSAIQKKSFADGFTQAKSALALIYELEEALQYEILAHQDYRTRLEQTGIGVEMMTNQLTRQVKTDVIAINKTMDRILISVTGATIFLFVVIIFFIGRRIVVEIGQVSRLSDLIRNGNLSKRLELISTREINALGRDLNAMADALEERAGLAQAIAKGDLTIQVNSLSEEDRFGEAFGDMISRLSEMIRQIRNYATRLNQSSDDLTKVSADLVSGADKMKAQAAQVAGATDQLSESVTSTAAGAEQMSQTVTSLSSAIEEMTSSIDSVAKDARNGSETADQAMTYSESASQSINSLKSAAVEIGNVTEVIQRIAEQTNLLALNATIEAASAGDAGKGFAVVANEIKALAQKSGEAAQDIARQIASVQTKTSTSIEIIEKVFSIISHIKSSATVTRNAVEQQRKTALEISANIMEAANGSSAIASAMNEASGSVNEVVSNMAHLNENVTMVSNGTTQVSEKANDLSGIASQLQKMVARFQLTDQPPRSSV
jgi:methyl-accepting chemotaxis protein